LIYGGLKSHIPNRADISQRPAIVETRARYGDWEGDTMVGHRHQGHLVTHVERKSRFILAGKASDGSAASFNQVSSVVHLELEFGVTSLVVDSKGQTRLRF